MKILLLVPILLMPTMLFAQTPAGNDPAPAPSEQAAAIPEFPLATVNEETTVYPELGYGGESKTIPAKVIVIIIGKDSRYSTDYYKIAYHGKTYFILEGGVSLDAKNTEKLDNLGILSDEAMAFAEKASKMLFAADMKELVAGINKTKKYGLTIVRARVFDVSEYTEGTGFGLKVHNPTDKTIKYVAINVVGLNSVNDPVKGRGGNNILTVRAVGPIEKDYSGTYNWDYVWLTDLVETFRITSVKVTYMDNTFKTLSAKKDIDAIRLTPRLRTLYEESLD